MAQDFVKKKATRTPSRTSTTKKSVGSTQKRKSAAQARSNKTEKRKTNSRKPSSPKKTAPFWAWILISICIIGFGFFLTQLSSKENGTQINAEETNTKEPTEEQISQVKFDFYEILKGKEVNVDERAIEKTPEQKNITYFLQTGSFKQLSDADTLRAKLLLQGLPVSIEKTTNKNGQEWHRVVAGPFDTRSKLAKARGILASNEINSIVLKR